jgi:hypothetical protein
MEQGTMAAWNTHGYKPEKGYMTSGKPISLRMIPYNIPHQGYLCSKCMITFSAYKIEQFTDRKSSPKQKEIVARPQTFNW